MNNTPRRARPADAYVVRVDGWFDYKWQQFSGTTVHGESPFGLLKS